MTVSHPLQIHIRKRTRRPAFSMVESIFSLVLVSGVMVVALNTVGSTFQSQQHAGNRIRAELLADDLLSEILAQAYEDEGAAVAFGLESGEGSANRSAFDDVDDYRSMVDSPPKFKDGSLQSGFSDWSRSVMVVHAVPTSLNTISLTETGIKRITVTVKYKGAVVGTVSAVRTGARPPAGKSRNLKEILDYITPPVPKVIPEELL